LRYLSIALLTLTALSCATAPQSASNQAPQIWAGLRPGAYSVGFKSWLLNPPSSDFKYGTPHPVQMNVWYPAETGGTPLRYADYVLLSLSEKSPAPLTEQQREGGIGDFTKYLTLGGVSAQQANALADGAMYARRDAPPLVTKKFPVVYIAQGNAQAASAQAVLAEFLASHGYVVVTTPSITRLTKPLTNDEDVGPTAAAQMEDIDKAVSAIREWPNAATDVPVALVAHSLGARGALMYAMHHPASALVSLEGGIGMASGKQSMLNSPSLDLRAEIPPVLHFYELNDERIVTDFGMLRSLRTTDLEIVRMESMRHGHFTTDGFGAAMLPDLAAMTKAPAGLKGDLVSFAQQTLAFIDKNTRTK
jgi:dienelactone hydrolase